MSNIGHNVGSQGARARANPGVAPPLSRSEELVIHSQTYPGQSPGEVSSAALPLAHRQPTANARLMSVLSTVLLLITASGCLFTGATRLKAYLQVRSQERWLQGSLEAVARAQTAFHRRTDRYAGSPQSLNLHMLPDTVSRLKVVAVPQGDRLGFVGELCDPAGRCVAVDARGQLLEGVLVEPSLQRVPERLTPLPGRFSQGRRLRPAGKGEQSEEPQAGQP